jgi:hypothetical protein
LVNRWKTCAVPTLCHFQHFESFHLIFPQFKAEVDTGTLLCSIVTFKVSVPCMVCVSDADHWNSANWVEFDKEKREDALNKPAVCTYEDPHAWAVFLKIRRQKISWKLKG